MGETKEGEDHVALALDERGAPAAGVVTELAVTEGQQVDVGQVLAVVQATD